MNKTLIVLAAAALLLAGAGAIWYGNKLREPPVSVAVLPSQKAAPVTLPSGWIDAFELTERSGKQVGTDDLKGKVWAASFFFADCPSECHQQNLSIGQIQKELGPQGVTFVSITVNPSRDTPGRLREYAARYTKSPDEWLFLTGDLSYIRRIGAEYFRVPVNEGEHGSKLILVDKWGNIRGYYSTNPVADPEQYASIRPQLKKLLAETEPPEELKPEGAAGDQPHEAAPMEAASTPVPEPAPAEESP